MSDRSRVFAIRAANPSAEQCTEVINVVREEGEFWKRDQHRTLIGENNTEHSVERQFYICKNDPRAAGEI